MDEPELTDWLAALRSTLADLPADGYDVVAHSLGAVLWLHHVADTGRHARGRHACRWSHRPSPRTTIAPRSPAFFPPPMDVDAVRRGADGTVLVGRRRRPVPARGIAEAYGRPLMIATTVLEGGGHVNVESGLGPWPAVLDWCGRDNLAFY